MVAVALVAAGAAMVLISRRDEPVTYEATHVLELEGGPAATDGGAVADPDVEALWVTDVPARAADRVGVVDADQLAQRVTLADDGMRGTVSITATAGDPERAAFLAKGFAAEVAAFLEERDGVRYVTRDEATGREREAQSGSARLWLGVALGIAALAVGWALAIARDRFDRRIRTRDNAEAGFGLPVLAEVPRVSRRARRRATDSKDSPDSRTADAYRELCDELTGVRADDPPTPTLIMVTSAEPRAGKTATAANLASAYAERGRSVRVVSEAEPRLLDAARRRGDVVIFDAPPVLSTGVSGELATMVDAVVVACRAGRTKTQTADECVDVLDELGAPTLGVVLLGGARRRARPRRHPQQAIETAPPVHPRPLVIGEAVAAPAVTTPAIEGMRGRAGRRARGPSGPACEAGQERETQSPRAAKGELAARALNAIRMTLPANGRPSAVNGSRVCDRELVERCGQGDEAALDELYRRYWSRLTRFCLHRVNDREAAHDVALQTFLQALRAPPTVTGDRAIYPWMTVIADRLCLNHQRTPAVAPVAPAAPVAVSNGTDPCLTALRRVCLSLPETSEVAARGRPTFRAGGKIFAAVDGGDEHPRGLAFKPDCDDRRRTLLADPRFYVPPYLGPRGWVAIDLTTAPVDWDEVAELIEASYRKVARKRMLGALDARLEFAWPAARLAPDYSMRIPEMARLITSCWICSVPSKMS